MSKTKESLKLSDYIHHLQGKTNTYTLLIVSVSALITAILALMFIVWQFSVSLWATLPALYEKEGAENLIIEINNRINEMIMIRDALFIVFIFLIVVVIIIVIFLMQNIYIMTNLLYKEKDITINEIKKKMNLEKSYSVKIFRFNKWLSNIRKKN